MSTLRKDPVSGGWVIMAEERSRRTADFAPVALPSSGEPKFDPFTEGNEYSTPPEIYALRAPGSNSNGPGWSLRVIPNKFAVLRIEGDLDRRGAGLYDMMNGLGAHEVVVETPNPEARMGQYSQDKLASILRTYRQRVNDLNRDQRFKYIQIFRNYGASAGALLDHPHSQIIALPITPRWVKEELTNARAHFDYKQRCLFCDIINQELEDRARIVYENSAFIAFAPFAAKFPFETWILPKVHNHDFQFINDSEIPLLADAMRRTLYGIQLALENPPFNFIIHSAPRISAMRGGNTVERDYHWHIEIIPRVTRIAGFEWGTGFYVNPTLPEKAAEYMREVINENPESDVIYN